MQKPLAILHAAPLASDQRALTALRLGGAPLADSKHVCLFLIEDGLRLIDPQLAADHPCRALFREANRVGPRHTGVRSHTAQDGMGRA